MCLPLLRHIYGKIEKKSKPAHLVPYSWIGSKPAHRDPYSWIGSKTRKEGEQDLKATCDNALKQIGEKGYTAELKARNIAANNIFVYGIAFEGKKVLIRGGSYASIDWENLANKKA